MQTPAQCASAGPFIVACQLAASAAGPLMEAADVIFETRLFWRDFQAICQIPGAIAIPFFVLENPPPQRWLKPGWLPSDARAKLCGAI